ncbi:MAG: hypothetical protein A2293_02850 [Elusimicrobia bacterium RIFOXYB2_FULL_49_7]|nr:MAG: hypothetical protein A2293_02850 [Elusimicrobia bacterium RIFOXYB2_FULL_49_7]
MTDSHKSEDPFSSALKGRIEKSISAQFAANQRRNLFYQNYHYQQHFLNETRHLIETHRDALKEIDRLKQSDEWIDRMAHQAYETFCRSNQFLHLPKEDIAGLRRIYEELWREIVTELANDIIDFDRLQQAHVDRLAHWLAETNGFTKQLNPADSPEIIRVVCSEYSAEWQLALYGIDLDELAEPILDIGCGKGAHIVRYLRDTGFEAIGLDRLGTGASSFLLEENWLEFDYVPDTWGTLLSNHAFALHFLHHHSRSDGEFSAYGEKYMEMLRSIKKNGTFYYAPSLPFIETLLPTDQYQITQKSVSPPFSSTCIRRLF